MKTTTQTGPVATYALIESDKTSMSVRLTPGLTPASSLRQSAQELRDQATRLQKRAAILEEAALLI